MRVSLFTCHGAITKALSFPSSYDRHSNANKQAKRAGVSDMQQIPFAIKVHHLAMRRRNINAG